MSGVIIKMNIHTPRIVKTVRASNNNAPKIRKDPNTDIYEKKTVNVTRTVSSTYVPTHTNALPRSTRRSNRQLNTNRRVEIKRGYTPIKRTVITQDSTMNKSNLGSTSFGKKSIVTNKETTASRISQKSSNNKQPIRYSQRASNIKNGKNCLSLFEKLLLK
jgi:hypothetical protein